MFVKNPKNILIVYISYVMMPESEQTVMLSDVDKMLLNALAEDARLSYRQLAAKAGCSAATAMKHVKALEENGVIDRYAVKIAYSRIGYDMQAIIDVRIAKGKLEQVEKKIAVHPNVAAVYDNTGPFDATIIAKFTSRRSLDGFLKKIQTYDFVERTETKLLLGTIKEGPIRLR